MKIKILGVGSPFGDDQIGWHVIDVLQNNNKFNSSIILKKLDRPHLHLIQELQGADKVYIIDAMQSGAKPGSIKRLSLKELREEKAPLSSHEMGVIASLQLGLALDQIQCEIKLIGIEIESNEFSQQLSAQAIIASKKAGKIIMDEAYA